MAPHTQRSGRPGGAVAPLDHARRERDPPLIPIAYEQIYDAYYNKVKGQNPSTFFGIYDVCRWDQVWLAQS